MIFNQSVFIVFYLDIEYILAELDRQQKYSRNYIFQVVDSIDRCKELYPILLCAQLAKKIFAF